MMHKLIECPTCGNEVVAKSVEEPQKCKWCRRMFRVKITKRNKNGNKAKFNWEVEEAEFEEFYKPKNMGNYSDRDVYGRR